MGNGRQRATLDRDAERTQHAPGGRPSRLSGAQGHQVAPASRDVMTMQRSLGNQATVALLEAGGSAAPANLLTLVGGRQDVIHRLWNAKRFRDATAVGLFSARSDAAKAIDGWLTEYHRLAKAGDSTLKQREALAYKMVWTAEKWVEANPPDPQAKKDAKNPKPGMADFLDDAVAELGSVRQQVASQKAALLDTHLTDTGDKQWGKVATAYGGGESSRFTGLKREELDKSLKSWSQIKLLSLADLEKYVADKAQWDRRSDLTDDQRDIVRALLPVADSGPNSAFLTKEVAALAGKRAPAELAKDLGAYASAVATKAPFALGPVPDAKTAAKYGRNIRKLLIGFPDWVLKAALNDLEFRRLVHFDYVDDVVNYYTSTIKPTFQADDAADFKSYTLLRREGGNPASYAGTDIAGHIRNFHRFQKRALDQLVANYKDKSQTKPLTLVLQSAIDHNGAFHRDPQMTAVIEKSNILTLVVEGGETLAAYQSEIGPLAAAYGMGGKLQQVMFAGHGESKSMELAGGVEKDRKGKLAEYGADIDVESQDDVGTRDQPTLDLLDSILDNMDDQATREVGSGTSKKTVDTKRRILFNACLTNSNVVEALAAEDRAGARKEIREFIKKNPSLALYTGQRAKDKGKDVSSLGANASITQVELMDSQGSLDLVDPEDPKVTASKLEYARHGKEPGGTLRAALEAWAHAPADGLNAIRDRSKAGSTAWKDVVIESMYTVLYAQRQNDRLADVINWYAEAAHGLSALEKKSECRVEKCIADLDCPVWMVKPVLEALLTRPTITSARNDIRLVLRQLIALKVDNAKVADVAKELETGGWTARTASDLLDVKRLQKAGLMKPLVEGTPLGKGQLIAAIVGWVDRSDADSKAVLEAVAKPAVPPVPELPKVPAVPEVPGGKGPRALVPKVPKVVGRAKFPAVPGKRPEVPEVPELPELAELAAVKKKGATAPGRPARPERAAVPEVAGVDAHFDPVLDIPALLDKRVTEVELARQVLA